MKKPWLEWTAATAPLITFLTWKLTNLVFRFGDGNAYMYMANALWQGILPYRDFFLADPPVFVLLLAALKPLFGSHLILYQALPVMLEAATALLLFLLARKWNIRLAALAPAIYLFSFTVLSTSDFLTGVQLVVFFSVLALFVWEKNHPYWSGILWALAILTKLYALPAFIGFLIFVFWRDLSRPVGTLPMPGEGNKGRKVLLGTFATGTIIMLPFLILDFPKVWQYLVVHQLHRPHGQARAAVWGFFFQREWLVLLPALVGAWLARKKAIFFPLALLAIFFALYQDLYYLYLDNLFFYLIIFALLLLEHLWQHSRKTAWFLLLGLALSVLGASMAYQTDFRLRGRFLNAAEIAAAIKILPDNFPLYGSHEVAPLVALLSERPLFGNYIDTNAQAFGSGAQDREAASMTAAQNGVYLLARITDLPEYNIKDVGYEGFFSPEVFTKACRRAKEFPSPSRETDNLIVIYRCKN